MYSNKYAPPFNVVSDHHVEGSGHLHLVNVNHVDIKTMWMRAFQLVQKVERLRTV